MVAEGKTLWEEFRPTIYFLLKFLGIYFAGSLLYGIFINYYDPEVDPVTSWVTHQSAWILNGMGWETKVQDFVGRPATFLTFHNKGIVSVYEGCNGLNVMIVFLSFMVAFGPNNKNTVWFTLMSFVIICIANLARIIFLFFVVIYLSRYTYFMHKYFFTAFIYLVVLLLWLWWVRKYGKR